MLLHKHSNAASPLLKGKYLPRIFIHGDMPLHKWGFLFWFVLPLLQTIGFAPRGRESCASARLWPVVCLQIPGFYNTSMALLTTGSGTFLLNFFWQKYLYQAKKSW